MSACAERIITNRERAFDRRQPLSVRFHELADHLDAIETWPRLRAV